MGKYWGGRGTKVDPAESYLEQDDTENNHVFGVPKPTMLDKLEVYLQISRFGMGLELFNTFLSCISVGIYVGETYVYDSSTLAKFQIVNLTFASIFLLDFALRLLIAKKKIKYLLQIASIVDLLSTIPVFVIAASVNPETLGTRREELSWINIGATFRMLRIIRLIEIQRLLTFTDSEIKRHLYSMALTVLCIIFLTAGILHLVENARELYPIDLPYRQLDFLDVIYLIVTTITTVGYGDIVPVTTPGRIVIMVMMTTALIVVPRQTNRIVAVLSLTSVYQRQKYTYNGTCSHVVVTGEIRDSGILEFFYELFHEDHGNNNLHAVIMDTGLPNSEMQALLADPKFAYKMTYLDANVMTEVDLKRAAVEYADAVFVLTNKFSKVPDEDDANTILRTLFIKRYIMKHSSAKKELGDTTVCLQLLNAENKALYSSSTVSTDNKKKRKDHTSQIICLDEIKMSLLAKSCLAPGMSTMINNLISSSGEEECEDDDPEWMKEYNQGVGKEIYRVSLSDIYRGIPFLEVAKLVYEKNEILLFALELDHEVAGTQVVINPGSFKIPTSKKIKIAGFVVAEDQDEAEELSNIEPDDNNFFSRKSMLHINSGPILQKNSNDNSLGKLLSDLHRTWNVRGGSDFVELDNVATKLNKNPFSLWNKAKQLLKKQKGSHVLVKDKHYVTNYQRTIDDACVHSVSEVFASDAIGHIIVIGNPGTLYNFIMPLRSRKLPNLIPLVILSPSMPTDAEWQYLAYFEQIYVVVGSPLEQYDLQRVKFQNASRVVIFAHEGDRSSGDALSDADTIFAFSMLSKLNDNVQIIGELRSQPNVEFLSEPVHGKVKKKKVWKKGKSSLSERPNFSPPFAAGYVYTSSMLDTVVSQAYYNRNLIDILQHLVTSSGDEERSDWERIVKDELPQGVAFSTVHQIPVPKLMHGKTYGEAFKLLALDDMMPMGLRRGVNKETGMGKNGNSMPYVFTNPSSEVILHPEDDMFVLSLTAPEDDLARTLVPNDNQLKARDTAKERGMIQNVLSIFNEENNSKPNTKDAEDAESEEEEDEILKPKPQEQISLRSATELLESLEESIQGQLSKLTGDMSKLLQRVAELESQRTKKNT